MALARFDLTTPHTLREIHTETDSEEAARQMQMLEAELEAIRQADEVDYGALKSLRIGPGGQMVAEANVEKGSADVDGQAPEETPEPETHNFA